MAILESALRSDLYHRAMLSRAEFYKYHHTDRSYCHECQSSVSIEAAKHDLDEDGWIRAEAEKLGISEYMQPKGG